jgi:hypothetical protein
MWPGEMSLRGFFLWLFVAETWNAAFAAKGEINTQRDRKIDNSRHSHLHPTFLPIFQEEEELGRGDVFEIYLLLLL